jgi:hypothetical protein
VHTWWHALLELFRLFGVLEDECVKESMASNFKLGVIGLLVLLYPRRCKK